MSVTFRGGKLAPHPEDTHPRLKLRSFLDATTVQPPATCDWLSAAGTFPMDGNDDWGDCVWACYAHEVQATTAAARGTAAVLPLSTVLAAYSAVTGFNPNAGPPGSNDTDQGTNMQDGLTWWRKNGYGGHSIAVFAQVDHTNQAEVLAAADLFGAVSVGFNFPDSAMDQFNNHEPWTMVKGATVEGGHAVHAGAYDRSAGWVEVVTWGARQRMDWGFWEKYVDEAWVKIPSVDWFNLTGKSPSGLDLCGLGAEFSALTGENNPFPAPTPVPDPPAPQPTPDPGPVTDTPSPADIVLYNHVKGWIHQPHLMLSARTVARELRTWAKAKGLTTGGT